MKDITLVFKKAIACRNEYNSKLIATKIEMNYDCWCRLEDDSNLKWYLISKTNGKTVIKYYGYLSKTFPVAIVMDDCPNEIVTFLFESGIIVEKYYKKYKCDEIVLKQFVDKHIIDDSFLFNEKIPFNEELFSIIDDGIDYINPCDFRFEELLT
ncbi:hypothetical protein SAMN02910289_01144 [Lachnospiraceae bacterium RM5]|nr:hypothetical protein SAMN02910289_01144 [Lachnospiraceae bacterium RM5]